jgi:hypothetical protein
MTIAGVVALVEVGVPLVVDGTVGDEGVGGDVTVGARVIVGPTVVVGASVVVVVTSVVVDSATVVVEPSVVVVVVSSEDGGASAAASIGISVRAMPNIAPAAAKRCRLAMVRRDNEPCKMSTLILRR